MKIAIITGGSRGLGKNMALHLAKKKVGVIITYQSNLEEAQKTAKEIENLGGDAAVLKLDVSQSATFTNFTQQTKEILNKKWSRNDFDFLVNNAGIGIHKPIIETSEAEFDQLMNIHLKGPFFLTQKLLPIMTDGGRILNVSTGLTRFALPGYAAYATMKGGIETLTKYLAKELGTRKIAVNVLAPGAIETDFGGGQVRDNKQLNDFVSSQTALGRAGKPDDIGGVVAALLTEETGWINAQRIEASGGMFL